MLVLVDDFADAGDKVTHSITNVLTSRCVRAAFWVRLLVAHTEAEGSLDHHAYQSLLASGVATQELKGTDGNS